MDPGSHNQSCVMFPGRCSAVRALEALRTDPVNSNSVTLGIRLLTDQYPEETTMELIKQVTGETLWYYGFPEAS